MVALSAFNTSTGGLAIGDWLYSAKPLAAPEYLPLNDDTASYLSSSYPTLAATYAPTAVSYSAVSKAFTPYTVGPYSTVASWNFLFGNGSFVGWSLNGDVVTSTDLTTWTSKSIPAQPQAVGQTGTTGSAYQSFMHNPMSYLVNSVAYGSGKLVAIRNANAVTTYSNAYGTSAMSQDGGSTWIFGAMPTFPLNAITPFTGERIFYRVLGYGNGQFVAIGTIYNSSSILHTIVTRSPNGVTWSDVWAFGIGAYYPVCIAYGNGVWMYFYGSLQNCYRSTNNAISFTNGGAIAGTIFPKALAYGAGLFVVVGDDGTGGVLNIFSTSPNGVTWTTRTVPISSRWSSITYANGYFVAVGSLGSATTTIVTSPDGVTWTSQTVPSASARSVVAGGLGKFVFQNDTTATITEVSFSAATSTFTLPIIPPLPGTQTYMKAT